MADRRGQPLAREAMAYVLAGGRGTRLAELTERRAKPAVYFGGKARIIDFALSNAINSGIRRIGVATQYKAHSLIRHLQQGWNFLRPERNESFDILPASQRVTENQWYEGTADAVFQNIDIIESHGPEYMVILAGDHIYKMDYELMLQQHSNQAADVTVACLEVPRASAGGFGVMTVDTNNRIIDFIEKPSEPTGLPGNPEIALASMGVYAFRTKFLIEQLHRDAATLALVAISGRISFPGSSETRKPLRIGLSIPAFVLAAKKLLIGAMLVLLTHIGRPISILPTWYRSSIFTIGRGHFGPMQRSLHPPNLFMM